VVALLARDYPNSLVGGVRFVELFCLVPLALMAALRTRTDAVVVIGGLLALGVVEGVDGLYQSATGTGALIGGTSIRAVGTFGAYNIAALADVSAMGLTVCLALGIVLHGRVRFWAFAGAAFFVLPLAFSLARSAWIAAAVAVILVISRGRLLRLFCTLAVVGLVGAAVLPAISSGNTALGERLSSVLSAGTTPDQSLIDRQALWRAAARMAFDHPLTGVGPRAFPAHRDAYADLTLLGSSDIGLGSSFARVSLDSPHDFYLLVAAEDGLVAAGVFGITFAVLAVRGFLRAARRRSDLSTALTLAGAGVFSYELVAMITGDLGGPDSIFVAVIMGLAGWAAADVDLRPRAGLGGAAGPDGRSEAPRLPVEERVWA
jgi:O-antigen ligase